MGNVPTRTDSFYVDWEAHTAWVEINWGGGEGWLGRGKNWKILFCTEFDIIKLDKSYQTMYVCAALVCLSVYDFRLDESIQMM